jgi:hypothetical protein
LTKNLATILRVICLLHNPTNRCDVYIKRLAGCAWKLDKNTLLGSFGPGPLMLETFCRTLDKSAVSVIQVGITYGELVAATQQAAQARRDETDWRKRHGVLKARTFEPSDVTKVLKSLLSQQQPLRGSLEGAKDQV